MTRPQPTPTDAACIGGRKAAGMLGVDERTIRRWADDGTLEPAYTTTGGHRRYRVADVQQLRTRLADEASS